MRVSYLPRIAMRALRASVGRLSHSVRFAPHGSGLRFCSISSVQSAIENRQPLPPHSSFHQSRRLQRNLAGRRQPPEFPQQTESAPAGAAEIRSTERVTDVLNLYPVLAFNPSFPPCWPCPPSPPRGDQITSACQDLHPDPRLPAVISLGKLRRAARPRATKQSNNIP
jgi:hypothetical protein